MSVKGFQHLFAASKKDSLWLSSNAHFRHVLQVADEVLCKLSLWLTLIYRNANSAMSAWKKTQYPLTSASKKFPKSLTYLVRLTPWLKQWSALIKIFQLNPFKTLILARKWNLKVCLMTYFTLMVELDLMNASYVGFRNILSTSLTRLTHWSVRAKQTVGCSTSTRNYSWGSWQQVVISVTICLTSLRSSLYNREAISNGWLMAFKKLGAWVSSRSWMRDWLSNLGACGLNMLRDC